MKTPKATLGLSRRTALKLLGLAAASIVPSLSPARAQRASSGPPNIILIIADALRADHVSSYGYSRATTPNLDTFITAQGVRFVEATTASPWTLVANAAIATGRMPSNLGVGWNNIILPSSAVTLAQYLKTAGYETAGFNSAAFIQSSRGFARGFDHYDDSLAVGHPTSEAKIAEQVTALTIDWLKNQRAGTGPLFLFVYYFDPHTWYNPPAPYDTLYDPSYSGSLTPSLYRDGQDVIAGTLALSNADVQHLIALYDGEIAYYDHQLGLLMQYLENNHLTDNAVVVATGDHGDMFGEHGLWTHGNSLYEEVMRVPLVMRYPGHIPAGHVVTAPVHNMDLMPTLLDWAGVVPPAGLAAVSRRALAEGAAITPGDVFSELQGERDPAGWAAWVAPYEDLRSLKRNGWKYIHHVGFPDQDELYLLNSASVYETNNQLQAKPQLAAEMRQAIIAYAGRDPIFGYLPLASR